MPWLRCGRAGRPGIVVNLSTPDTKFVVGKFSKHLGLRFDDCEIKESRLWAVSRGDVESEWKSGRTMADVDGTGGVSEGLYGTMEVSGGMPSGTISEGVGIVTGDRGLLPEERASGEVAVVEEKERSMGHGLPRHLNAESVDDVSGFHKAFLETDDWVLTGGEEANDEGVSIDGGETGGMEEGSPRGEVAYKVPGGVAFKNLDSGEGWDEDDWGDGDWGDGDVSEGEENRW